jgi:hypothetical protein
MPWRLAPPSIHHSCHHGSWARPPRVRANRHQSLLVSCRRLADLSRSPLLSDPLVHPTAAACMRRVLHFYALRDRSKEQAARLQYHTGRHVTSCAAIKLPRPAVIGRPPDPTADPDPSCTAALAARATGKLSTTSQASHSCFYNSGTYVRHTAGERVAKNLRSHH